MNKDRSAQCIAAFDQSKAAADRIIDGSIELIRDAIDKDEDVEVLAQMVLTMIAKVAMSQDVSWLASLAVFSLERIARAEVNA